MIIIGHRGARGLAPENTVASIERAIACGVDEVEVDVRVTADGVPVLNHNRTMFASGKVYIIHQYSLDKLCQLNPDLATLQDALHTTAGRCRLQIEVKHTEPTEPVIEIIRLSGQTQSSDSGLLLGSKSQRVLLELHHALPDIPKIVIEPWSGIRATLRARRIGTKRISMRSWWLWSGFLRSMQRRGYLVTPYTINSISCAEKWRPYIYGIVTDYPDRFVDAGSAKSEQ